MGEKFMRTAVEFREIAREVLQGKWKIAVIAGLVASLLGGISGSGPEVKLNIDASHANISFEYAGQTIISTSEGVNTAFIVGSSIYIVIAAIALAAVYFILGSIVETGYARFNLDLNYGYEPTINKLFDYLSNWRTTSMARFLQSLYGLLSVWAFQGRDLSCFSFSMVWV